MAQSVGAFGDGARVRLETMLKYSLGVMALG